MFVPRVRLRTGTELEISNETAVVRYELQLEELSHLSNPLPDKRSRRENKDTTGTPSRPQFLDHHACHDCLAQTRVVREEEPLLGGWDDLVVDCFYLVW